MIVKRACDQAFPLMWPRWQPPGADGLAAFVAPHASTSWANGLLARDGDQLVVWAAVGPEPEVEALTRLQQPGVRAITLTPTRSDPRWVRLALEFAVHLAQARASATTAGPCLTSWSAPVAPAGVVRIPHLITVARDGAVTDAVVWELLPATSAQHWLGGPLPDQVFFESHLDDLLRLRAAARRGQLPARAAATGIADLMADRELSIHLVYEHAVRFRALLAGQAPEPRTR